jgi:hypothetical protein
MKMDQKLQASNIGLYRNHGEVQFEIQNDKGITLLSQYIHFVGLP